MGPFRRECAYCRNRTVPGGRPSWRLTERRDGGHARRGGPRIIYEPPDEGRFVMQIRSIFSAAALLGAALSSGWAFAQPGVASNPSGSMGRDWAMLSFRIGQGHQVIVTATNSTVNAHPGNSTSITVY